MYAVWIVFLCVKTQRVFKGKFASSVFHSCNAKMQKTQICVTGPQRVNTSCLRLPALTLVDLIFQSRSFGLGGKLVQQLQYIQLTLSLSLL
jgi:hypothetical protein